MDAYEATKIVFQRIQNLDPQNASKVMGVLLIQDHGEKEMIRLAFGPEALVHSVIIKARKELNLPPPNMPSTPSTPHSPSPFSNNTSSRLNLAGINLPSPLSISNPSSCFSDYQTPDNLISPGGYNSTTSPSTMNSSAPPFYGGEVDLIDELQLQDQLSFLNDGGSPPLGPKSSDFFYQQQQDLASSPNGTDPLLFPSYGGAWGAAASSPHRRSCSVSDICMGGDDLSGGFGWKPCLFYARGYCKNGTSCRFLHGEGTAASDGGAAAVGSPIEMMEQCHELLRSKSTSNSQLMGSNNFPYSPASSNKCMNFLLQQQIQSDSPRGLMMGEGMHKFGRARLERGDFGINGLNSGSRQIYLTFPADSTFKEEDVSNYFSNFGPVQDVRIPYQQKRMFGFVTFDYPETVKLILAKGNPHFVCDARVLVKPYKEKGKIPDKHRKQQPQMERGEFTGCGSPTGLDSRDPYDLHLGARMFYNTQDMLWRRKLEEQADLQQAIELQNRRFVGLQLLDVKRNNNHHRTLSTGAVVSSPTSFSPTLYNQNLAFSSNRSSPEAKENGSVGTGAHPAYIVSPTDLENVNVVEKDNDFSPKNVNSNGKDFPSKESDFHDSLEHNLPDSPFASPKATAFSNGNLEADKGSLVISASATNNKLITGPSLFPAASSLDMASPFKSCYFQLPRFASGHETIGM